MCFHSYYNITLVFTCGVRNNGFMLVRKRGAAALKTKKSINNRAPGGRATAKKSPHNLWGDFCGDVLNSVIDKFGPKIIKS